MLGEDPAVEIPELFRALQVCVFVILAIRIPDLTTSLAITLRSTNPWPAVCVDAVDLVPAYDLPDDGRNKFREVRGELACRGERGAQRKSRHLVSTVLNQSSVRVATKPFRVSLRNIGVRHIGAHAAHDTDPAGFGSTRTLAENVTSIQVRARRKIWDARR